jgi:hypothetical protein
LTNTSRYEMAALFMCGSFVAETIGNLWLPFGNVRSVIQHAPPIIVG